MTHIEFRKILIERITKMQDTLDSKGKEYASDEDRLHNFKSSEQFSDREAAANCWGFLVKHLTSLRDIVNRYEDFGVMPTPGTIDEKIGDAINYLVLLEAIFRENQ